MAKHRTFKGTDLTLTDTADGGCVVNVILGGVEMSATVTSTQKNEFRSHWEARGSKHPKGVTVCLLEWLLAHKLIDFPSKEIPLH